MPLLNIAMHILTSSNNRGKCVQQEFPPPPPHQPWLIEVAAAAAARNSREAFTLFGRITCHLTPPRTQTASKRPYRVSGKRWGIYIASKTVHAGAWRLLRDSYGLKIISTWIDEADAGQSACLQDLSRRCIEEAKSCERFVLFCEDGEILKGALLECGAALASNINVYCVGDCPSISRVFENHPLWHKCATVAEAFGFGA